MNRLDAVMKSYTLAILIAFSPVFSAELQNGTGRLLEQMALTDVAIKSCYDSDKDNVLEEFYIPVLKETIEYRRMAGYFSSKSLSVAARGIRGLLERNGSMKMIVGAEFNKRDIEAIREGKETPIKVIERVALEDFDSIEDMLVKDYVKALAWLLAKEKLEIRIAVVKGEEGLPLDEITLYKSGIFHPKGGIFIDENNDMVSFSGSINETASAWKENIEGFKVFKSWEEMQYEQFLFDYSQFEDYWGGISERFDVFELPEAIKRKMIRMAPTDIDELNIDKGDTRQKRRITPFKHQEQAINEFRNNNYKGILKMATGTGKTYTALLCLEDYFNFNKEYGNRVLIIVNRDALVDQWTDVLQDFTSSADIITSFNSYRTKKEKEFATLVWKKGVLEKDKVNIFNVVSIDSIEGFGPLRKEPPDFIIADEVHSYSTDRILGILEEYFGEVKYRLGLSATPELIYDPERTIKLFEFFGPIVYRYNIKQGQEDGILAKYSYEASVVKFTEEEEEEISSLTRRIGKCSAADEISDREGTFPESLKFLLIKRANIVKKANNKLIALRDILNTYGTELQQCIVYCLESNQLHEAEAIFSDVGINTYIIYMSTTFRRKEALGLFKNKYCNYVLAMFCLDQGIDIPSCESLILLASSGNPREYIQRRGRVLRNPKDIIKPDVKIFDVIVIPENTNLLFRELVKGQLVRAWEYIKYSQSPEERYKLNSILEEYDIQREELDEAIEEWS